MGEGLVQPMINFTADFTVGLLKAVGIPVYREGNVFTIPTGKWSVVEACSGVRYLIASVTLGVLFAYLTYTRWYKRALFVVFAFVVPVFANGLRAFMIVLIGHLSDMKLATGVDHLVYGWLFFGLVIFLMFAIGSLWRDDPAGGQERVDDPSSIGQVGAVSIGPFRYPLVAIAVVVVLSPWVLLAPTKTVEEGVPLAELELPSSIPPWQRINGKGLGWSPEVGGAAREATAMYELGGQVVSVYVGVFPHRAGSAEMVTSNNVMVSEGSEDWEPLATQPVSLPVGLAPGMVSEYLIAGAGGRRLVVWTWYRVGNLETRNRYLAKMFELWVRMVSREQTQGAILAVAAAYSDKPDSARGQLELFLRDGGEVLADVADGTKPGEAETDSVLRQH